MKITLKNGAFAPERAHATDAGLDLRTTMPFEIAPFGMTVIDTGVCLALPAGTMGMIRSKSGLMARVITADGTIDEGYRGSIRVVLFNHAPNKMHFLAGDKIAQLVIAPVLYVKTEMVKALDETERGENGFGSTGR